MTTKDVYAAYGIAVRPAALDSALSALRDKDAEIARLQAQVDALAVALSKMLSACPDANDGRDGVSIRVTKDCVDACRYGRAALAAVCR